MERGGGQYQQGRQRTNGFSGTSLKVVLIGCQGRGECLENGIRSMVEN